MHNWHYECTLSIMHIKKLEYWRLHLVTFCLRELLHFYSKSPEQFPFLYFSVDSDPQIQPLHLFLTYSDVFELKLGPCWMPRSLFKQIFFKYLFSIVNSVSAAQRELKSGARWLHSASVVPDSPCLAQFCISHSAENALQGTE